MNSVWTETFKLPAFPRFNGDRRTDVLIIGGGLAGILCAHMLKEAGVEYMLLEADRICGGTTKNTTAKITYHHGLIFDNLTEKFGVENAGLYLEANALAFEKYEEMCQKIDCDFEYKDSFVYSLDSREKIERDILALEKIGYKANFYEDAPLPFSIAGAVGFKDQAQFHPLKFLSAIAKDLNIFEHMKVQHIENNYAITDFGRVHADNIIFATHFPFINRHGSYFMKLYQHRSYLLGLENAQKVNGMYVDESDDGMTFRNYGDLLLLGGGGHRTGKTGGNWRELMNFANNNYPTSDVKYCWASQDCKSLDNIPYIGNYSKRTPGLYVATGFNKWGITSSMVAAQIITDMITGKENIYAPIFSPSRTMMRRQLVLNAMESTANMLSFSRKRCPHMGCALKWNGDEHSWDCPCHGSRFTSLGKLIDNPANSDLK